MEFHPLFQSHPLSILASRVVRGARPRRPRRFRLLHVDHGSVLRGTQRARREASSPAFELFFAGQTPVLTRGARDPYVSGAFCFKCAHVVSHFAGSSAVREAWWALRAKVEPTNSWTPCISWPHGPCLLLSLSVFSQSLSLSTLLFLPVCSSLFLLFSLSLTLSLAPPLSNLYIMYPYQFTYIYIYIYIQYLSDERTHDLHIITINAYITNIILNTSHIDMRR